MGTIHILQKKLLKQGCENQEYLLWPKKTHIVYNISFLQLGCSTNADAFSVIKRTKLRVVGSYSF